LLAAQGLRTATFLLGRISARRVTRAASAIGLAALCAFLGFAYWRFLQFPIKGLMGQIPRETYLRAFDRATQTDFSLVEDRQAAAWVQEHTEPGTPVFIWGFESLVYFLADRPSASRFLHTLPLIAPWSPPEWRAETVRDLEERRPPYILVLHNDPQPWLVGRWDDSAAQVATYPELARLLELSYEPGERIGDFEVWGLKGIEGRTLSPHE
jgi:hypothetical protein